MTIIEKLYESYKTKIDKKYWCSLKDSKKGRRVFIIGNGPSLSPNDLTKIYKNEDISIASNKIYLIYPKTDWRPNYYTVADPILWSKIDSKELKYFSVVHKPSYLQTKKDILSKNWNVNVKSLFDRKCNQIKGGGTVTLENIQIAMLLGCNKIYLIGCDHNYGKEIISSDGLAIHQNNQQVHFDPNYRMKGEKSMPADINLMNNSYETLNKYAKSQGVSIYNATRGGHLEIFERVNFEALF